MTLKCAPKKKRPKKALKKSFKCAQKKKVAKKSFKEVPQVYQSKKEVTKKKFQRSPSNVPKQK
jgi:hypothetical protein